MPGSSGLAHSSLVSSEDQVLEASEACHCGQNRRMGRLCRHDRPQWRSYRFKTSSYRRESGESASLF